MRYLLAVIFFLLSSAALAEDPYPVRRTLPRVEPIDIEGAPHMCFNKTQYQILLLIARDYQGLYDWRLEIQGTLKAHTSMVESYELRIKGYENELKNKDRYIAFQKSHIEQITKKHQNIALEERIEKYIMWAVIIAETVVIGVIGAKSL